MNGRQSLSLDILPAMKRYPTVIEMTGEAMDLLDQASEQHGMKKILILSRLVEFFVSRDMQIQSLMVDPLTEDRQCAVGRRILESLTSPGRNR